MMKVREFIEKLQRIDPEMEICLQTVDEGRGPDYVEPKVEVVTFSSADLKWRLFRQNDGSGNLTHGSHFDTSLQHEHLPIIAEKLLHHLARVIDPVSSSVDPSF